jgi:SAM-dependent methyltransferase
MTTTTNQAVIDRERAHYQVHGRYLLSFLERDRTESERWLIRRVLATWDRQLALLPSELIRDRRVLEIGCGNPRVLQYFAALGAAEVIGNDLAPAFVQRGFARPHNYAAGRAVAAIDVPMRYGDATGQALRGLTVDTVTCFQSLHHLDLPGFVAACNGVLAPGGHVAISDPTGDHPLRRLGDAVGRGSGLLSPDEKARPAREVIAAFLDRGFELLVHRSLNPTLEIYFHLTELLAPYAPRLAFWAKALMAPLRPLDDWLEAHVLPRRPHWGWRYFLIFRKTEAVR